MAKKKTWTIGYILLIVFVAAATTFLMLAKDPERVTVTSEDYQVVVDGPVREGTVVRITKNEALSRELHTAVVAPVYDIEPNRTVFEQPLDLTMFFNPDLVAAAQDLALGYFDTDRSAWRVVPSEVDGQGHHVQASVDHFSPWTILLKREVVISPDVIDLLDSMIANGFRENVVGYTADIAYSTIEDDFVILFDDYREGGCNTVFQIGDRLQTQAKEIVAPASVDGEEQEVTFKVLIDWQLGEGCSESGGR